MASLKAEQGPMATPEVKESVVEAATSKVGADKVRTALAALIGRHPWITGIVGAPTGALATWAVFSDHLFGTLGDWSTSASLFFAKWATSLQLLQDLWGPMDLVGS